jgi:hypothetical protein
LGFLYYIYKVTQKEDNCLFVSSIDGGGKKGSFLPAAAMYDTPGEQPQKISTG